MKIGIDISSIVYGTGVSDYTSSLVEALVENYDQESFTLYGGSLRKYSVLQSFGDTFGDGVAKKFWHLPPKIQSLLFNQWHLPIESFAGQLDVFHSWDWYTPRTRRAQLITTIHDLSAIKSDGGTHPEIVSAHQKSLTWIKKEAKHIIAVSESTKQDIMAILGIEEAKISVIYEAMPKAHEINPSNQDIQRTQQKYHLGKPYFIMVASQEPRKNMGRTIKAFEPFAAEYNLVLVGKEGFDVIDSTSYVIKTGYLNSLDLASLIRGSQGLLYPSLSEGFGLPILEGFFHKVPVVTSAVSSMPEVAGDGASYCDPLKIESISKAIHDAIKTRHSLIEKGTKQLQVFSWKKAAEQTMAVYRLAVKD